MEAFQALAFFIIIGFSAVAGFPQGPPPEACQDMFPTGHHNHTAQNTTAPFEVHISGNKFAGGTEITVTVRNTSAKYFEGLFVQARRVSGDQDELLGSFKVPDGQNLKTMDCSKSKSAVSQSAKDHYYEKQFTWIAPADFKDNVRFRATIVHETEEFWVDVFSNTMSYDASKETNGAATLTSNVLSMIAIALLASYSI